jgi:hypothetical protein
MDQLANLVVKIIEVLSILNPYTHFTTQTRKLTSTGIWYHLEDETVLPLGVSIQRVQVDIEFSSQKKRRHWVGVPFLIVVNLTREAV